MSGIWVMVKSFSARVILFRTCEMESSATKIPGPKARYKQALQYRNGIAIEDNPDLVASNVRRAR